MPMGPRNSVIAALQGAAYDLLMDISPWIVSEWMPWQELHELWIDKVHDFTYEGD